MFSGKSVNDKIVALEQKVNALEQKIEGKQSNSQEIDKRPVEFINITNTTLGPNLSNSNIYFRSVQIETKDSLVQIFKPESTKKNMKLTEYNTTSIAVAPVAAPVAAPAAAPAAGGKNKRRQNKIGGEDSIDTTELNYLFVIRSYTLGNKKYNLIFRKPISDTVQNTPYKLAMISYESNTADFIELSFDEKYDKNNKDEYINKKVIQYIPVAEDKIYKGGNITYSNTPIPFFSKTLIKDSVGLLSKFLLKMFDIKTETLLLSPRLDPGFEPGHPYRFVIAINDIDRDFGQLANYMSGTGITMAAATATAGWSAAFQDKIISLDDKELIDKYIDELVTLKRANQLENTYGGKRKNKKATQKKNKQNKNKQNKNKKSKSNKNKLI